MADPECPVFDRRDERRSTPQNLDMAEDTPPDEVLRQLKKLREGKGLTTDRLRASPAVLSAIATSDPVEALNGIKVLLDRLGSTDQATALRVDFGLSLAELLGREPSSREVERLGERRAAYAELVNRDVKTLARWSDRAIAELRGHLLADFFDGQVVVAAGVRAGRIIGIEVMQYDRLDEHLTEGRSISYSNPQTEASLPLLLYGFPRDWKPKSIRFIVSFLDEGPSRRGHWSPTP